jgi:hypothetical protein
VKPIIYVAAPVSGDPVGNTQRAIRWVRWFVEKDPTRIYIAPWVAEVLGFASEALPAGFYQHVLDDDVEVVARCSGLVGVAGKWSGGMLQERVVPRVLRRPLLDMTRFLEPTDVPDSFNLEDEWKQVNPADEYNYVEPY